MLLAATLIARNEARCIRRCLESVRPWVDRIVLVDTGSTDDTPGLAERAGAEVYHLDWPNDFSAARNHALDLADADWNLVIDADEWLLSGGAELRRWCAGPARIGAACIHNAFDLPQSMTLEGVTPFSRSWIPRLLPRGVRYQGRVHEQPASPLPRHRIDLNIAHDGYLDAHAGGKRERNLTLLLGELEKSPDDPYLLYQLGTEAETSRNYSAASEWYAKAFARTEATANWCHALIVRYLHCMGQAGDIDVALTLAQEQIDAWPESPDFYFVLGNLAMDKAVADPAGAIDGWLPLAVSAWERCLEIGERPELEGSVHGRGSHLARHNLDVIRSQLALIGA